MLHSIGIQLLGSPRTMLNHRPIISTDTPEERKSLPERSRKPRRAELPEDGQSKERVGRGGGVWKHQIENQKAASLEVVKVPEMSNLRLSAVLTHPDWKSYRFNNAVTNVILEEWKLRFIPRLLTSHGNTRKGGHG
jgi:hypothetical protein